MVNRKNNFMSKNRVILEFIYKISELSELLYLVLLVLRMMLVERYGTSTMRTCLALHLFCLALAPTSAVEEQIIYIC